jgi:hypothetical protein
MVTRKKRTADAVVAEIEEVSTAIADHDRQADELRERRIDLWVEATTSTPKPTHKRLAEASGVTESFVTRKLRSRGVMTR